MNRKILWLHGFGGSARSGIVNFLRKYYPQFEWVAPELTHRPGESFATIDGELKRYGDEVAAVIGTSLGGYYASCCAFRGPVLVINPAMHPYETIQKFIGKNRWYGPRSDGSTEFTVTEDEVEEFLKYPLPLGNDDCVTPTGEEAFPGMLPDRILCHYCEHDPILGEEVKADYGRLFPNREMMTHHVLPGHVVTESYIVRILPKFIWNV